MLTRFYMAQNIRALVLEKMPEGTAEVRRSFIETFDDDRRGTLINDVMSFDRDVITYQNSTRLSDLDDQLYGLLKSRHDLDYPSRRVFAQHNFWRLGAQYSARKWSKGESFVVVGSYPSGPWSPAQITDIFVLPSQGVPEGEARLFVAVTKFRSLADTDIARDPYRAQDRAHGVGLLSYVEREDKILLDVQDIVCHFAHTPMDIEHIATHCMHVLPLYRVSGLSTWRVQQLIQIQPIRDSTDYLHRSLRYLRALPYCLSIVSCCTQDGSPVSVTMKYRFCPWTSYSFRSTNWTQLAWGLTAAQRQA